MPKLNSFFRFTLTIGGIGFLTNWSFYSIGVGLINIYNDSTQSIGILRNGILSIKYHYKGIKYTDINNDLSHNFTGISYHNFNSTQFFNPICENLESDYIVNTTFFHKTLVDKLTSSNIFRILLIIDAIEKPTTAKSIRIGGALLSISNEKQGTHSLFEKIEYYNKNSQFCPTPNEAHKILKFTQLNPIMEATIYHSALENWTNPTFTIAKIWFEKTIGVLGYISLGAQVIKSTIFIFMDIERIKFYQDIASNGLIPHWHNNGCIKLDHVCLTDSNITEECIVLGENIQYHEIT